MVVNLAFIIVHLKGIAYLVWDDMGTSLSSFTPGHTYVWRLDAKLSCVGFCWALCTPPTAPIFESPTRNTPLTFAIRCRDTHQVSYDPVIDGCVYLQK